MARILFVEDEQAVLKRLLKYFEREGFEVRGARTGADALEAAASFHPDVAVLDVMLHEGPGGMEAMDGYEICRGLRDAGFERPVIFLTARSGEQDKLLGFELGADDYVTKPFSTKELVLRVKAAARRAGSGGAVVTGPSERMIRGIVHVDLSAHRVWVDGEELDLTATEYRLLVYLADHEGKLCERGELLEKVWELPPSLNTRTVDTHIKRLRQKLEGASRYVETVRGAGYRFRVLG